MVLETTEAQRPVVLGIPNLFYGVGGTVAPWIIDFAFQQEIQDDAKQSTGRVFEILFFIYIFVFLLLLVLIRRKDDDASRDAEDQSLAE